MRRAILLLVAPALFLSGGPLGGARTAKADLVTYTSQASFNNVTSNDTTVDFEGIAPPSQFTHVTTPPGITVGGVNFDINTATSNGNLYVVGDGYYYSFAVLSSQESGDAVNNLVITLPQPYTAVAFDVGTFSGTAITVTFSSGATANVSPPTFDGIGFFGFTSTVPIVSLELDQASGDLINLKDFQFGTAVPEPASLGLLAMGVGGAVGLTWLRTRGASRGAKPAA
jgi:hypothetical protein